MIFEENAIRLIDGGFVPPGYFYGNEYMATRKLKSDILGIDDELFLIKIRQCAPVDAKCYTVPKIDLDNHSEYFYVEFWIKIPKPDKMRSSKL